MNKLKFGGRSQLRCSLIPSIAGLEIYGSNLIVVATVVLLFSASFMQLASAAPWRLTDPMSIARYRHSATLLSNGKVLVAGGYDNEADSLATAELFNFANEKWTMTGSMNDMRGDHTATKLKNGMVLVTGGFVFYQREFYGKLATAELFNPHTGSWQRAGSMTVARVAHTATLLANGQVLVAGGGADSGATNVADIYDYAQNTWTATGSLNTARLGHTATLLRDGKVLIVGGVDDEGDVLTSAELYNPSNGTWTNTGFLNTGRYAHTATLLPNGKVLVAGGYDTDNLALVNSELFDPSTETWTETSTPLNAPRGEQVATLLFNGQVLFTGGFGFTSFGDALSSVEIFCPRTAVWTIVDPLNFARGNHTSTLLPNGKVLVTGGYDDHQSGALSTVEINGPLPFHATKRQTRK